MTKGNVPVMPFNVAAKNSKLDRLFNEDGKVPAILFAAISNKVSALRFPISDGILPLKELYHMWRMRSLE